MRMNPASPLAGLFSAPKNPDPGLNPEVLDSPEQFPDPNAAIQLSKGASSPLYGGAGVRQLGSIQQAQRMQAGSNGQQQPLAHAILRTLWNGGQMTPPGVQKQKAVAPSAAAVNTFAAHGAAQSVNGQMNPPIAASAPGMPGQQDIAIAQNAATPPAQVIRTRMLPR